MVFGAGMVVLAARALREGTLVLAVRRYYVRSLLLVLVGLVHVFWLGWFADFVHIYGLVAIIAFPLSRLRAPWLLAIGSLYAVALVIGGVSSIGAHVPVRPSMVARGLHGVPQSALAAIAVENQERTATPTRWSAALFEVYASHFGWGWVRYGLCEAGATMLIGAGLFKSRVLQGDRSRGFYRRMAAAGYLVGLAIRIPGAWHVANPMTTTPLIEALGEVGRLSMALGHVAALTLLLDSPRWRVWLAPLSAVGRMSLSVYLCQTLLCLWLVFSPIGLGLYGRMGWTGLMATAALVDIVLVVAANRYLRYWRIGPVEWIWRSLATSRALPLRVNAPRVSANTATGG